MRRTWLLIICTGFAALAMWPSEAMARWYYCRVNVPDSPDLYWSELFEIPGEFHGPTMRKVREDYASYVRQSHSVQALDPHCVENYDGNQARINFDRVMSGSAPGVDRNARMIPTRWTPRMGSGARPNSIAAPPQRTTTPPRIAPSTASPVVPGPSDSERANSARLNAQQAAAAKRQREQIQATVAAKRAADAKYLSDKAAAEAKYLRDKAAVEAENARRAAAYKAAQAEYARKRAEYDEAINAGKSKKAGKDDNCRYETRQATAGGQAKALEAAKSAALRELERQKAITVQMSNTVISSGAVSCRGGPTPAGGVEMETDYSCTIPLVINAKVCTAKPASGSQQ